MYFGYAFFVLETECKKMYIHKNLLIDETLTNREKIVFAYLLNFKKQIRISNKEIAIAIGTTEREIERIVAALIKKKYIVSVGNTNNRKLETKKSIRPEFKKGQFNGFNLDDDILVLKLDATKKLILAEIRSFLNSKIGKCAVSNSHFAKHLNITERTVRYALENLEKAKFIKREFVEKDGMVERRLCLTFSATSIVKQDKQEEEERSEQVKKIEEQKDDEAVKIFDMYPKRPDMTEQKVQEQKNLCLPILKNKTKEELEYISYVINSSKSCESWKAGFIPYMYTFLTKSREKYFNESTKSKFEKFKRDKYVLEKSVCNLVIQSYYDEILKKKGNEEQSTDEEIYIDIFLNYSKKYKDLDIVAYKQICLAELKKIKLKDTTSKKSEQKKEQTKTKRELLKEERKEELIKLLTKLEHINQNKNIYLSLLSLAFDEETKRKYEAEIARINYTEAQGLEYLSKLKKELATLEDKI